MVDLCTTCRCIVQTGAVSRFKLECRKTTCEACPMVREGLRDPGTEVTVEAKQHDLTGSLNLALVLIMGNI